MAWATDLTTPLITDELPQNWFGWILKFLFSLNLIFSYPLVLHPAHIVIENYLYNGMAKSKKRQWLKNLTRTILVGITVIVTVALGHELDKFLGLLGALTCTPIAFSFPAIFHYKALGHKSTTTKLIDISLFVFSLCIMAYCTFEDIIMWED